MASNAPIIDETPLPLPATRLSQIVPGSITLLEPLSRKGSGPGMIVLVTHTGTDKSSATGLRIENGAPSPIMKWAEEGYTVVEVLESAFATSSQPDPFSLAVSALSTCKNCQPQGMVGLVTYSPSLWNLAAPFLSSSPAIKAAVAYANVSDLGNLANSPVPHVIHLAGKTSEKRQLPRSDALTAYQYPLASSHLFATPFQSLFHYAQEGVSHTRSLTLLKKWMNGPYFDLDAIWEEHTYYEFDDRSVAKTMATMVQEPYVNHVTTLTGGIGRETLTRFYRDHFIWTNPADTDQELISRTIGIDRVIDEFIFKCTHDKKIDWLIPGVPATNRKLEIPMVGVVNIRGDRLYHEHISWDQSTVLFQLGLMPEYLPIPYSLPYSAGITSQQALEYRVPGTGIETVRKMQDKNSVPSNKMLAFKVREVDRR